MAYDPDTDLDPGYDIEGHAQDQDRQDAYERTQFRRVSPEVYSPTPAPAPTPSAPAAPAAPTQRQGLALRSNLPPAEGTYTYGDDFGFKPSGPPAGKGSLTWKDYGDEVVRSALGSAGALAGAVDWAQKQLSGDPELKTYAGGIKNWATKHAADTFDGMTPRAKEVLSASLFGDSTRDAEGNAIPSAHDVGFGGYAAMHLMGMVPDALAMLLPGGILGKVAVKGAELLGVATRAVKAGETVATLTRAGQTAQAVGHGAGMGGYFGTENLGSFVGTLADEVGKAKDETLAQGSEYYNHLRTSGMSVDDAKRELIKQSTPFAIAAFAAGFAGGAGFGVLGKGVIRGAIAGAGAMGIQGGATTALQQGAEKAAGIRQDYDLGSIISDTITSGAGGAVLGAVGGRFAGRERAPSGVDPDVGEAFRTYDEPAGPPQPPGRGLTIYGEQPGPPSPPQGQLDLGGAPPGPPRGGPQGEMFPTIQEANQPPGAPGAGLTGEPAGPPPPGPVSSRAGGMPGATQADLPINQTPPTIVPTTGQGELYPSLPEANPPRPIVPPGGGGEGGAPAATQKAVATSKGGAAVPKGVQTAGVETKAQLLDELRTTPGVDPRSLEGQSRAQLKAMRDRLKTGDQNTTVVNGAGSEAATTPVRSESLGQAPSGTTAPPAARDLTPSSAPEGVSPTTELTGQEPDVVRSEGGPSPDTMAKSGEGITAPPKAVEAIKVSKRAAQKAKMTGGVEVAQAKGHVEAPTEGTRTEAGARAQEIATREQALEAARSDAINNVRDSLDRATRNVIPLKKGDAQIAPAIQRALRDLVEGVGHTDGTPEEVSKAVGDWARDHPGRIPGTETSWFAIGDRIHNDLTGRSLPEREAFAREAGEHVEAQPRAVESETQKRQTEREEATTTKEQDIAREEAHAAGEAIETSAGMTAAPETAEAKVAKGTSADVRGRQLVERALDPNDAMTPLSADREFGGQNVGRGRKRLAANADIRVIARKMLKEASNEKTRDRIIKDIGDAQTNQLLTEKEREVQTKRLLDDMSKTGPERIAALERFLKEVEDPVGDAASKRAELEAKMAERSGKPIVNPMHAPRFDGISHESSAYIKATRDPVLNKHLMDRVDNAEFNGGTASLHGMLDAIINHAATKQALRPLWEMARKMRSRVADLPVVSPDEAVRRGWMSIDQYVDLFNSRRRVAGYHLVDLKGNVPEHIVLNSAIPTHTETILHEIMHASTSRYIDNLMKVDPGHRDLELLRAIGRELQQQANKVLGNEDYLRFHHDLENVVQSALVNPHEVHAWLMTNPVLHDFASRTMASPEFRARLSELGYAPRPQGRSILRYFADWVYRTLGLDRPASGSETSFLDHMLRPLQDITERGERYNERLLPTDPALRAQAEPLFHDLGTAFRRGAGEALERIDPAGLSARAARGMLSTAPLDRIIERYGRLAQDGERNYLRDVRAATERAQTKTASFLRTFGDKTRDVARALRGKDDVANLMNDVGYARAALGTTDAAANAHLTTPDERAQLTALQRRFDALPREDQELYKTTRDLGTEKYLREREAIANNLINRFLPDATDAEKNAMRAAMRTRATLDAFLADPTNASIGATNRVIARGLATLHRMGFVQGDYFPMRRFGDFVVQYGEHGTPSYGVQFFESRAKAEAFRRDAASRGMDPQAVRERNSIVQSRALPTAPVIEEMLEKVGVTPGLRDHAQELREMVTKLQLQYASGAERGRARRARIAGASKDVARAIQGDTASTALRIGAIEHAGERDAAMRALEYHNDVLARANNKDALTLDQVRHELQRRFGVGDDAGWSGASGLARRLTSFGYAHSLMSFSRLATETAELHLKMGAFIGARHGMPRAALELGRALKDISPSLWTKGMSNTAKAFIGKPLSSVDYQLSEMARDRLLARGYNAGEVNAFFKHFHENGLFDQTTAQALKELARPSNMGKAWNWMLDVTGAMSHASEESNRIAGAWAAFRAERSAGRTVAEANRFAEDTLRKAPNFSPANRPRIATDKGVFGKFSAPIMQFKLYGLNEGWMLANLARDIISRSTDPAVRKEAIYGLAGTVMAHSMMAGILTWYADPVRYLGGAYDMITGQKPQDRSLVARKWLADTIGPTAGELLGRGLPHAIGWDVHRRLGVENMLNIPEMNGFTPKDWAQFAGHIALGAPGEDASTLWGGFMKMLQGDFLGGAKDALPRIVRDPVKAYDLSQRGVVDTRGKQILAPEKLSTWDVISQGLGIAPSAVSEVREKRNAIMQVRDRLRDEHTKLTNAWLEADNQEDRAAIMSEIRQWNADPSNFASRITVEQLHKAAEQRRKDEHRVGAYGLTLPKKGAQQLMEAGRF